MKHALIIGATGGIGQAVAQRLNGGYRLTLVGRNPEKLRALQHVFDATVIPTDVSSELEVQALFADVAAIDVLIYSAGAIAPQLIKLQQGGPLQQVIDANLTGLIYTLKHAESTLADGARVFVLGARPELITYRGFSVYAAAKAGAKAVTEIAAIEMKRKASFTLVLPKAVATPFWENVGTPPKDALSADEVAKAIADSLQGDPVAELKVG
jgi:NAD(P)-dependent dehydrogenase (short-subunit alcohol dehydrogenase family)